jgi:hypothetical protein
MSYITRISETSIYESFAGPFVTALLGPRRVGKSTLVAHYKESHPEHKWVSLNMDIRALRNRVVAGELRAIIQEEALTAVGAGEKIWVSIDEAQKCPECFDQIKVLYDQYKDKDAIKFILTGSGALHLHQFSAETLAGRIQLFYLHEFGLKETALLCNPDLTLPEGGFFDLLGNGLEEKSIQALIEKLSPYKKLLNQALQNLLIYGGLPEVNILENENVKRQYLGDYIQTYLEKDVRDIQLVDNLNVYEQLLKIAAEQTGSLRDDTKIIEALGCARNTLKKYRGLLQATLVYEDIYPYIGSTVKRIVKSPKGYLLNNGLISFLTGLWDTKILEQTGMIGHRLETTFLNELRLYMDAQGGRFHQVYYWRTQQGIEVDFILELAPAVYPFEVTHGRTIQEKKVRRLSTFMNNTPQVKYGFYIYNGEFKFDKKQNIFFIPFWLL